MLSAAFCNAFEGALERGKSLPPKEAFDACVSVCKKHNVGYDFRGTRANFLVREENKSRLMLSAGQAHKNGEKIHYGGADLDKLKAAYAFQFCKVAMVGDITSRSRLQIEGASQLGVPKLKRNANFRIMMEQGWQWYIFPSELDDTYPAFAKLSQRALNSANNCRQTCSEIELACQMVEFHNAALAN